MTEKPLQKRRCAVYTRKSSEEGLEQEFNSLAAQREACEAYIASQKHEGWVLVPAGDVERLVEERFAAFLKNQGEIFDAGEPLFDDVNERQEVVDRAADLAARWPDLAPTTKRRIFECLVNRIELTQETLEIRIAPGRLLEILWQEDNRRAFEPALWDNELTAKKLAGDTRLPIAWEQQRARLGIA